jgi:transcriptional regulator with XRE-family HTH domain
MTPGRLKQIRETLGLTQKGLAGAIFRHANTIARYERGDIPIPPIVAQAVEGLLRTGPSPP